MPNRAVAQRPSTWRSASVRIQQIGPSAYSYALIEPDVSMISPTCGCRIGAVARRVICHGCVLTGRPVWRCARARVYARPSKRPPGVRLSTRRVPVVSARRSRVA